MNIQAVNCTPIKPKTAFGMSAAERPKIEEDIDNADGIYHKINDCLLDKVNEKVKNPIEVITSVALAGLITYASGKKIGYVVQNYAKGLPNALVAGLKKSSSAIQNFGMKISADGQSKVKNVLSKGILKGENVARNVYKNVIAKGAENNSIVFQRLCGIAALSTVFPPILKRDSDENGIKDIMEKGKNAYTGAKSKTRDAFEKTNALADLIDALT